jgi:hypothetical protein
MVTNKTVLNELRKSWNGVRKIRNKVQRSLLASHAQGASSVILIADIAHNLTFIHAYSVLNDVLLQIRNEKRFKCTSFFLRPLMKASKDKLSWNNFNIVMEGVERRNDIAHKGKIIPRGDCWKYIDAIEKELVSWNIIDST